MRHWLHYIILFCFCIQTIQVSAQIDSSGMKNDTLIKKNTSSQPIFNPKKATIRSAILPGWGQAYNKQYWKIPIVYAALGTTAGLFIYNLKYYNKTKYAYQVAYNIQNKKDTIGTPTYNAVDNDLKPILQFPEALRNYRNSFRQNMDYSALFFLLAWGLNVLDATVSAHLKSFNVSDDLSLKIVPKYSPITNTTGISLVVYIK